MSEPESRSPKSRITLALGLGVVTASLGALLALIIAAELSGKTDLLLSFPWPAIAASVGVFAGFTTAMRIYTRMPWLMAASAGLWVALLGLATTVTISRADLGTRYLAPLWGFALLAFAMMLALSRPYRVKGRAAEQDDRAV